MTTILISIAIWAAGVVVGYLMVRKDFMSDGLGEYTVKDRKIALVISVFSWLTCIAGVIIYITKNWGKDDRPASW